MRSLSPTLLAAQKAPSRVPYIYAQVRAYLYGAPQIVPTKLYSGAEAPSYHALAVAGAAPSFYLMRFCHPGATVIRWQRLLNPTEASDFATWYDFVAAAPGYIAAQARGQTVYVLAAAPGAGGTRLQYSTNAGSSWTAVDFPETYTTGNGAAVTTNDAGDGFLAVLHPGISSIELYAKQGALATWGAWLRPVWEFAEAFGLACYWADSKWNFIIAGRRGDRYALWRGTYTPATATWSTLQEVLGVPQTSGFVFKSPHFAAPVASFVRPTLFFSETYAGPIAQTRVCYTHLNPEATFTEALWHEPVPFDSASQYALAVDATATHFWLSDRFEVFRAAIPPADPLDLGADILAIKESISGIDGGSNKLELELKNETGKFNLDKLGSGAIAQLNRGSEITFGWGYKTPAGNEYSVSSKYSVEGIEYRSSKGKATAVLSCEDAWGKARRYRARYQVTDNAPPAPTDSVWDILKKLCARLGLYLDYKSRSATITGFYPYFTINPGDRGDVLVKRLLSFVPDRLFVSGDKAWLVNPTPTDPAVYAYGTDHAILQARHWALMPDVNHLALEGRTALGALFGKEYLAPGDTPHAGSRPFIDQDLNLATEAELDARASALFRSQAQGRSRAVVAIPPNCGQEVYDVVAITHPATGLSAASYRLQEVAVRFDLKAGSCQAALDLVSV